MILIDTIPKAGTYLIALLLSKLGLENSGLHFRNDRYWNFKDKPIGEIVADPDQYMRRATLEHALGLVDSDAFAVAHLHCDDTARASLKVTCATHVFIVRNLRECLISHMRFVSDPRRRCPPPKWLLEQSSEKDRMLGYMATSAGNYLKDIERQMSWLSEPIDCLARFETILGDQGEGDQRALLEQLILVARLDADPAHAQNILNKDVIGQATRTFSGARSSTDRFWSEGAEDEFKRLGGKELNEKLGYS
jgi:hypothetical protein